MSADEYSVEKRVCGSVNAMSSGKNPSRVDYATATAKSIIFIQSDLPTPITNYRFLTANNFVIGWSGEWASTAAFYIDLCWIVLGIDDRNQNCKKD